MRTKLFATAFCLLAGGSVASANYDKVLNYVPWKARENRHLNDVPPSTRTGDQRLVHQQGIGGPPKSIVRAPTTEVAPAGWHYFEMNGVRYSIRKR